MPIVAIERDELYPFYYLKPPEAVSKYMHTYLSDQEVAFITRTMDDFSVAQKLMRLAEEQVAKKMKDS